MIILDTPNQIQAYAYLQLYYKLKMEVDRPNGPRWRDPPLQRVREILYNCDIECPNRKAVALEKYKKLLIDSGILKERDGNNQ